jgi:hypothetical protein
MQNLDYMSAIRIGQFALIDSSSAVELGATCRDATRTM